MPLRRSKSLFGTDKLDTEGYLDPYALRKQNKMDDEDEDEDNDNTDAYEEQVSRRVDTLHLVVPKTL